MEEVSPKILAFMETCLEAIRDLYVKWDQLDQRIRELEVAQEMKRYPGDVIDTRPTPLAAKMAPNLVLLQPRDGMSNGDNSPE